MSEQIVGIALLSGCLVGVLAGFAFGFLPARARSLYVKGILIVAIILSSVGAGFIAIELVDLLNTSSGMMRVYIDTGALQMVLPFLLGIGSAAVGGVVGRRKARAA